jgi:hypothetical protein
VTPLSLRFALSLSPRGGERDVFGPRTPTRYNSPSFSGPAPSADPSPQGTSPA